jgi:hypothetical protein
MTGATAGLDEAMRRAGYGADSLPYSPDGISRTVPVTREVRSVSWKVVELLGRLR